MVLWFLCLESIALSTIVAAAASPVSTTTTSSSPATVVSSCPCDDEALCQPIAGPPVREREIFGFVNAYGSDGSEMNWTHVTTVAWVTDPQLVCRAHAHGARAILAAPPFVLADMVHSPRHRRAWIQEALRRVQDNFYDGIVFDYEEPQPEGSMEGLAYAKLIAETRDTFQAVHAGYQISTCVPWSPDNIDGRAFPWVQLADASDLLYVMDYDTRSQIFDACLASANAPFPGMIRGIQRYFDLGIDASELILGVPWYGYRYPCLPGTLPDAVYCPIPMVPFRGVNCSDAAGIEVAYSGIRQVLDEMSDDGTAVAITGGLRRDANMDAPFFNIAVNQTQVYQYWFDDTTSLSNKFRWAREHGLRGVGPYTFSYLDPHGADADIWSTFDVFLQEKPNETKQSVSTVRHELRVRRS